MRERGGGGGEDNPVSACANGRATHWDKNGGREAALGNDSCLRQDGFAHSPCIPLETTAIWNSKLARGQTVLLGDDHIQKP